MVQDPMNNGPQPVNRGWGWNREPWGAGCGWFSLFWLILFIIFAWGWWGGGWWGNGWGGRGWNGNAGNVPQTMSPMHVTNNYYFGGGADEFYGVTVMLKGKVDRVYNNQAFSLAPDKGKGADLLVIVHQQGTSKAPLKIGQEVEVTGTVQPFNRAELTKEGGTDLAKQDLTAFRQRPVIFATSVKPEEHPVNTGTPKQGG